METYLYNHFPDHLSSVHIALFTSVKNAAEIRSRIVKAAMMEGPEGEAEREAVNFAFIDAKLVRLSLISEEKMLHRVFRCRAGFICRLLSINLCSQMLKVHSRRRQCTLKSSGA